jgi:predicted dehydrogenase
MADTYGVLLLSFSRHSHQPSFVPLYQRHPRLRLLAVADEREVEPELHARNRQWADRLQVPYIQDVEQALSLEGVDIASIGCEIERRALLIGRAARAGKHLWIDKFPGGTIEECDGVVQAVEQTGVKAIVPSYAYGELCRRSLELLGIGRLGQLLGVHVEVMFSKGWPRPIRAENRQPFMPAGRWKFPELKRELLTVGAYGVGLIQACLGPIRQVVGHADAFFFPEHASRGAEDFGILALTDAQGRLATLCGGRIGVATHARGGPSQAHLVGSRGSALIDGKGPSLDAFLRQDVIQAPWPPPAHDPMQWAGGSPSFGLSLAADPTGLWTGLEDLVEAIEKDRPTRYGVRQARDLMEVLLAGYRSIERGEVVALPLERRAP